MPALLQGNKRSTSESGPAPGPQLQFNDNDLIRSADAPSAAARESPVRSSRRYNLRNRRLMSSETDSDVDSSSCSRPRKLTRVSEPAATYPKEAEAAALREPDSEEADRLQQLKDVLACSVCLDLCYEPCTVSCSHTFCKACLIDSLRSCGSRCPKCRGELNFGREGPLVNSMIWNCIQLLFPDECAERKRAMDEARVEQEPLRIVSWRSNHGDVSDHELFTLLYELLGGKDFLVELGLFNSEEPLPSSPVVHITSSTPTATRFRRRRRTARMNAGRSFNLNLAPR